jgi:hypothetical protein
MKQLIISLGIGIIVFLIVISVGYIVLNSFSYQVINQMTYDNCCNGMSCSDTYYTYSDNKCHLTLCENAAFTNKENCIYEGANKSINVVNCLH